MQADGHYGKGIHQHVLKSLSRRKSLSSGLRMTAMIDVIFLLLIFFLLTAKFRRPEGFLPVVLPQGQGNIDIKSIVEPLVISIAGTAEGVSVTIGADSGFVIEEQAFEAGLGGLLSNVGEAMEQQKRTANDPVEIFCDDNVKWDHLVKIYDVLYTMGIKDITFAMTE